MLRRILENKEVILSTEGGQFFFCWGCGTQLDKTNAWQCRKRNCSRRAKTTNRLLSYTPLYTQHAGGADVNDYRLAVCAAFCLGDKMPNDAAAHLCRDKDETWKAAKQKLDTPLLQV